MGRRRRDFWADYYFAEGPRAHEAGGEDGANAVLNDLLARHLAAAARPGHVDLVGAGPGDPELLTLRARKALDAADVVIHDGLVAPEILELARREALSLDEEIEALDAAGLSWRIVPGITAASGAAASIGQSLTRRGRNSALRILTGHDMAGFAEQDWRGLARPGEVAAIYMGRKSARFIQGRLMMHGAGAETPLTIVENATRPDERITGCCLGDLAARAAETRGPAVILYGLAPRRAVEALEDLREARS